MTSERIVAENPHSRISHAYVIAERAHENVRRKSGEPYINHPVAVFNILYHELGVRDIPTLAASLVHDVVEDTIISLSEIERELGTEVADLVDGVSKIRSQNGERTDHETLRKVTGASFLDPRVGIIKLADRLHNMRTIKHVPESSQIKKAHETLHVYVPLAESLGAWQVKTALEDLAFYYLYPTKYQEVKAMVDTDPRNSESFQQGWVENLQALLMENGIVSQIEVRKLGLWALWQKLNQAEANGDKKGIGNINDFISLRISMADLGSCYQSLGIIEAQYKNQIDAARFDNFILDPRVNGYRAIHHSLRLEEGMLEFALVTHKMEEFNRWGVLTLLRKDFVSAQSLQEFSRKLVFTPKNEVMFFPTDATVCDFSYSINETLGASAIYAIATIHEISATGAVSAREVNLSLSDPLPDSATLNVVRGPNRPYPPLDKIGNVLPQTKATIEKQIATEEVRQLIQSGREIMAEILKPRGFFDFEDLNDFFNKGPTKPIEDKLIEAFAVSSLNELYRQLALNPQKIEAVNNFFNINQITKNETAVTSILINGKNIDDPGVINSLSQQIIDLKGNVNVIRVINHSGNVTYEIRLVITGLGKAGEDSLNKILSRDSRFSSYVVI